MHLYGQTHYSRDYVDKSAVLKVSVIKTNDKIITQQANTGKKFNFFKPKFEVLLMNQKKLKKQTNKQNKLSILSRK